MNSKHPGDGSYLTRYSMGTTAGEEKKVAKKEVRENGLHGDCVEKNGKVKGYYYGLFFNDYLSAFLPTTSFVKEQSQGKAGSRLNRKRGNKRNYGDILRSLLLLANPA